MDTNKKLADATDEELLYVLLKRNGQGTAPVNTTRAVPYLISCVGIGKDHTADITLPVEDFEVLEVRAESSGGKKL